MRYAELRQKILFIPTNSREVSQFNLVSRELEYLGYSILAIALDKDKEDLLQEKRFSYTRIADYETMNMLNIIKKEKPCIIVTDFCGPITNAFIAAADHVGIPCLMVDDGVMADYSALKSVPLALRKTFLKILKMIIKVVTLRANPMPSDLILLATFIAINNNPIHFLKKVIDILIKLTYPVPSYVEGLNIAVMSPFAKDAYIKMVVPHEKVFVTGQPRFDMIRQKKFNRDQLMAELGILENKGIVILATQPLVGSIKQKEDRKKFITTVCSAMRKFPNERLVIKLHPNEHMKTYQKILFNIGEDKAIICQNIDIYELLHACDLLMTVHSTVALEAMIFDKPVITINLTGKPDFFPYAESGAAIGVYKKEDLVSAISKALRDPHVKENLEKNRKKFIYRHIYKLDGQASKRVANLIIRLIEESKMKKEDA